MSGFHEHEDNAQRVKKINKGEGGLWCSTKEKKGGNEGMGLKMGQRRKEVRRVNVRQG